VGKTDWINDVRIDLFYFKIFYFLISSLKTDSLPFVVCLCRVHTWKSPSVVYFLIVQLLAGSVALVDIYGNRFGLVPWQASCWGNFCSVVEHLGL
jgi:hypothetical protein